jgi:ribosomal protein S12 methylthiotransferase accessory factor
MKVLVVGTGRLARALAAELAGDAVLGTAPDAAAGADRVAFVGDGSRRVWTGPEGEAPWGLGVPWTPMRVELGTVLIGPTVTPGAAGCVSCRDTRRERARPDEELRAEARSRYGDRFAAPDPGLTGFGADIAARLAAAELRDETARLRSGTVHVRLDTLAVSTHRFLPDPHCPRCGRLPDDTEADARIELKPAPKLGPRTYRVRDISAAADDLLATYVDGEHGLVRGLQRASFGTYPTMMAPLGLPGRPIEVESGSGRELDYRTARLTALAEAVERYAGVRPSGRRTVVTGSYRELAERALDPRTLGLYPDERYAEHGFPYRRWTEDLDLRWVWGFSFARDETVLVPESCAYYRLHLADPTARPFVYEISNGCALGACLEEAILHGVLELVERDGFLLTWYARLAARRLDLGTARDRMLPLMAERMTRRTGYDVHAFDTTTEYGIPSVWVMAVDRGDAPDRPKVLCAAGAGFDPERALASALLELGPILEWRLDSYPGEYEAARGMVDDPDQVRSMHDHTLLYADRRAFDRFDFLLSDRPPVSIESSFAGHFAPEGANLTDDLTATIDLFLSRGTDVVVVDQTGPEQTAGGFRCVKVLIPGLLPMTFGHRFRRVDGLPRLLSAPYELGYADRPLRTDELNPHPHPFP